MSANKVLAGSLKFLTLGEVMQILGGNASSGILRIMSRYANEPGVIYFKDGNPVNAACSGRSGLDAVYSLFGWTDGEFEFHQEQVDVEPVINKSRMGIILEGLKMVDDGQIEKLGPDAIGTSRMAATKGEGVVPLMKGPLVDYMYIADEEDFFDGESIVEEGKHGSWIWVVLEGVVEIVKNTDKGPLPIVRVGDGGFIGSLSSFLIQGHMRTATVVAVGNVQLGVLDSQRLAQEFAALSAEFRTFLISIDRRLRQLNQRVVDYYTGAADPASMINNRVPVIKQGADEESLYQVAGGDAVVVRHHEKGMVPLVSLPRGEYFGSVPFMELGQEPEYASVLASKDLKVKKIDAGKFKNEYDNLSTTFKNMVDHMAAAISVTTGVVCAYHSKESR